MLFQFVLSATDTAVDPALLQTVILSLIKLLFLVGFGIYAIFAFIATRQIEIMKKTVMTSFSPVVQLLGLLHLGLAILVLVIFAITL
jgi:hypothetical protein